MKIFFSWQSDRPEKTGRYFVRDALQQAIDALKADVELQEAERLHLDHDTKDVPGSPNIAETILAKIGESAVFVADVTPIGTSPGGKPLMNPNVAIELGYSLATVGSDGLTMVLNRAHGERDGLPFDLRYRRGPIDYTLADDADAASTKAERSRLASIFEAAIRQCIKSRAASASLSGPTLRVDPAPAIQALREGRKDTAARVRDFMNTFYDAIADFSPRGEEFDSRLNPECDEIFVKALEASIPVVVEFGKLASAAAEFDSTTATMGIRERLHKMDGLTRGPSPRAYGPYVSFIVQELFVMLVAPLVRNERWSTLKTTLERSLVDDEGEVRPWTDFQRYIGILDDYRKGRLALNRISVASDIYAQRHSGDGELAQVSPLRDLEDADFLLMFVTAYLPPIGEPERDKWAPRLSLSIEHLPDWLAQMRSRTHAAAILGLMQMQADQNDIGARQQIFLKYFDAARHLHRRVWPSGYLTSPGDFQKGLTEQFFSLP